MKMGKKMGMGRSEAHRAIFGGGGMRGKPMVKPVAQNKPMKSMPSTTTKIAPLPVHKMVDKEHDL